MIRRITQIYQFEDDEHEQLNRATMDVAKLLIDKLDAKYKGKVELGLAPCGGTDIVIANTFYITVTDEDIYFAWPGGSRTLQHQSCVYETVHSILRLI